MKKVIYRTVIELEVLSDKPIPDWVSLKDIAADGDYGDFSIAYKRKVDNNPVVGKKAVALVKNQGSDLEFFNMDLLGNEIEEDENLALD